MMIRAAAVHEDEYPVFGACRWLASVADDSGVKWAAIAATKYKLLALRF
ncbi:hypothetical protein [Haliangium sp. UPWRP_2]|nr:hypothetical protein [Haliangium sp. UPWRP_2]